MGKKIFLPLLVLLYLLYVAALMTTNNFIGDMLSPVLTLIAFCFVGYSFVIKEKNIGLKLSGICYALCIFSWFISDTMWGISTLILHVNPETNDMIDFGYSLTSFLLLFSLVISGYLKSKKWDKMQMLLDTMIVSVYCMVFLWVLVFDQNMEKANILLSDKMIMGTLIADCLIYAWTNIWYFQQEIRR